MNEVFNIQIEDESEKLPEFVVNNNLNSVTLFDWQRRAIKYFFENNCKAVYEIPTGAGKTICAIELIKQIINIEPDVRVLIVVPKNVILETTWFKELYDGGFSLRDVGVYYGNIKEYGKITITNMQNLQRIPLELFKVIILDEIHNYGTKRLLEILQQDFKYMIGLSATVERMDNKHWDLLKLFDYNLFTYSPQQALQEGILNRFNFTNISVDLDEETFEKYTTLTQDLNVIFQAGGGYIRIMKSKNSGLKYKMLAKMNERKEIINNYPRKFDIIKILAEKHKEDKIIVFNEFNQQTNKCYWYLLDVGVKACIVHSSIPMKVREQNMMDFKQDKYNIMLTSKVLDEGYNLPKIDTGIVMAGNSSARQTIQRLGRVLRRKNKPSNLYQIYCKETVEENYAMERSKLFKELCSDYKYMHFDGSDLKLRT